MSSKVLVQMLFSISKIYFIIYIYLFIYLLYYFFHIASSFSGLLQLWKPAFWPLVPSSPMRKTAKFGPTNVKLLV